MPSRGALQGMAVLFSAKSNPHSYPCPFLSPQHFSAFFHSKVTSICYNLDSATVTPPSVPDQPFCGKVWDAFQSVSENKVKKILNQSTINTCELDPLPHLFWPTVLTIFSHTSHLSSTTLCTPAFSHLLSNQWSWSLSSRKQLFTLRSWKTRFVTLHSKIPPPPPLCQMIL